MYGCIVDGIGVEKWVLDNENCLETLEELDKEYTFCCGRFTPLTMTAIMQRRDLTEILLRHGAKIQGKEWLLLREGWTVDELFAVVLEGGNRMGSSLWENTLLLGNVTEARRLLELLRHPIHHNDTALDFMIRNGEAENVALLLSQGAQFTNATRSALRDSSRAVELIPMLVAAGLNTECPDFTGDTLLHMICNGWYIGKDRYATVQCLIENGTNVNAATPEGYTALMYVSATGDLDVVRLLVKNGADMEAKNERGLSAIDYARSKNRAAVVEFFYEERSVTRAFG